MSTPTSQTAKSRQSEGISYLTEFQLAERWQVSIKLIQKQRYEGTGVPYVKIGRLVRYRFEEVVVYEEACRRTSTSAEG